MTILHDFQAYLEQRYAQATASAYLQDVTQFFRWFEATNGEEPDPRAIGPSDIREYRRTLLNRQARPATINRRLAALSNFFRWARATGLAHDNPAQDVPGVRQTQLAPKWLSRKEQNALLRAGRKRGKRRDEAVIVVLLHTGLRVSELCNLRLPDLQLSQRKGEARVRGKGEKERVAPLNADARKALQAYLDVRPAAVHDYLFVGQRGDPMQSSGVQRLVHEYARRARFEEACTPHTLRHTFAKNLVDAEVSLDRVAALLGHENLNTTRIYTTPSVHDLTEAVERLEGE